MVPPRATEGGSERKEGGPSARQESRQESAARAGALEESMRQGLQEAHLRAASRGRWRVVPWDEGLNARLGGQDGSGDHCHEIHLRI